VRRMAPSPTTRRLTLFTADGCCARPLRDSRADRSSMTTMQLAVRPAGTLQGPRAVLRSSIQGGTPVGWPNTGAPPHRRRARPASGALNPQQHSGMPLNSNEGCGSGAHSPIGLGRRMLRLPPKPAATLAHGHPSGYLSTRAWPSSSPGVPWVPARRAISAARLGLLCGEDTRRR
jgi:hypothetical protein